MSEQQTAYDMRSTLREMFEDQARWRREKAKEYPADERNLQAVESLDRLAATVDAVPEELFMALAELDYGYNEIERNSEVLRMIGFHIDFENAEDFVRQTIAERTDENSASLEQDEEVVHD